MARLIGNALVLIALFAAVAWFWDVVAPWIGQAPTAVCGLWSLVDVGYVATLALFIVGLALWILRNFRFYPGGAFMLVALIVYAVVIDQSERWLAACGST